MSLFLSAAVAALLTASTVSSASAQRVIEITREPTCGEGRIAIERSVTLRPPGALQFRIPSKVVRDSRGRWYVVDPTGAAPVVAIFDSSGAFVGRLSYPAGQRLSDGVVLSGDTVRLYGMSAPSAADFGPDGQLVRTHALFASGVTGATPWQDASDRLWVLSLVATTDWKPYDRGNRPVGDHAVRADMHSQAYATMMDVIDLRTGQLLASQRFPEAFLAFAADGFLYDLEVNGAADDVVVRLWRVAFTRP